MSLFQNKVPNLPGGLESNMHVFLPSLSHIVTRKNEIFKKIKKRKVLYLHFSLLVGKNGTIQHLAFQVF